jgi:NADPH:quinone reductase-like Zn-dependent oxidoreductase
MPARTRSCLSLALLLLAAPFAVGAATCPVLPDSMRAARIHAAGGPEALQLERVPLPSPAAAQVLVRVHYASINPVDWKLQEAGRLPFPAIPGGDFSGEIVALGEGVTGLACGDLVAGIADPRAGDGSYAEYTRVQVSDLVPRPSRFSLAEAAAYPTVAVAAWRFLVATGQVRAGERVLVHGGAGGVGSMAVQIAKANGAYVFATASARNQDYLRRIGVDEPIDYRATRFEDLARDIDLVIDTVGGDTLARSPAVLRDGGRLVTMAGTPPTEACSDDRIQCPPVAAWDVAQGLAFVEPLIAWGALRINIDRIYPLDDIVAAQRHNRSGRTRGKVVVDLGAEAVASAAR